MRPATADDVQDLLEASIAATALGAAFETGLFQRLAERAESAQEIAEALKIPPGRCRSWLEYLSSLGLLERDNGAYAPSATARTAILEAYGPDAWAELAVGARERLPVLNNLPEDIHEGGSVWAKLGLTPPQYVDQMRDDPERARRFTRMLYELHQNLAEELAEILDTIGAERMMDLGGGSGVMSIALLRRNPQLHSVIVDIENVCAAGREIVAEHPEGERITYHAADLVRDELPGAFDLVLECDVNIYGEEVIGKLHAALKPGGRLVIVDYFAPAKDIAHPSRVHWAFVGSLHDPERSYITADDVRARLTRAGFHIIRQRPLSGGALLIEASR
jgi:predicted TPR repeat methyltransferase